MQLIHSPLSPVKFQAMPENFRGLIIEAKAHQATLNLGDAAFAGTILSGPAWNQLFNGNYPMPSSERGQMQLEKKLRALVTRAEHLVQDRSTPTTTALQLMVRPELTKVEDAIHEAKLRLQRGIEERLITVVGPTRSGKSCLIKMLIERQRVNWSFRALPSTKVRYRKLLEGLAKAVSLRDIDGKDVTELEEALLAKFSVTPCVLAIEELQRLSRRALEFLKCVLNETQATIILFLKPREWKLMKRTLNEDMQQFIGRNIATVSLHITAEMVGEMAKAAWTAGGDPALFRQIAQEAEKGGGMSAVRCIIENSARLAHSKPVSASNVISALKLYRTGVPELTAPATQLWGGAKKPTKAA